MNLPQKPNQSRNQTTNKMVRILIIYPAWKHFEQDSPPAWPQEAYSLCPPPPPCLRVHLWGHFWCHFWFTSGAASRRYRSPRSGQGVGATLVPGLGGTLVPGWGAVGYPSPRSRGTIVPGLGVTLVPGGMGQVGWVRGQGVVL